MKKWIPSHSVALESQSSTWIANFTILGVFWVHFLVAGVMQVQLFTDIETSLAYYTKMQNYGFSLDQCFIIVTFLASLVGFLLVYMSGSHKWWKILQLTLFSTFSLFALAHVIIIHKLEPYYVGWAEESLHYYQQEIEMNDQAWNTEYLQLEHDALAESLKLYRMSKK